MSSTISDKWQITLDRRARRALGLEPGMSAVQVVVGDHLEVFFVSGKRDQSAFGLLAVKPGTVIPPLEEMQERAEQSIARDEW